MMGEVLHLRTPSPLWWGTEEGGGAGCQHGQHGQHLEL